MNESLIINIRKQIYAILCYIKHIVTYYFILQRDLIGHVCDVYTCKFFPSGIVILSGGADMQLKVWSAETGQCAATIFGHKAGNIFCSYPDEETPQHLLMPHKHYCIEH